MLSTVERVGREEPRGSFLPVRRSPEDLGRLVKSSLKPGDSQPEIHWNAGRSHLD